MNYAVVIPSRYQSSRFPGKPLVDICGKPMIQHVWERCCIAVGQELVYVATDSEKIKSVCIGFGAQVVMTSTTCVTGTDRLAEVNNVLDLDFLINVQGDEPLIEPDDILKVIQEYKRRPNVVVNAMCPIVSEREFRSLTIPKVVVSKSGRLLYMSRSPIPIKKNNEFEFGYKQVCIYAISRIQLGFFLSHPNKTTFENVEDIEILRFLESDIEVRMIEVESNSIAVDVPGDVELVINKLRKRGN